MKVLIPAGLFYPSKLGGPSNSLYWLSKGLIKNNIEVSVVTTNNYIEDENISCNKWLNIEGIHVRYCTARSKIPFRVIWFSIKELSRCDTLLLSSICYLPYFFIGSYALFLKKKIIWSPRGELLESALNNNKWKLFYIRILKLIFGKTICFHATSKDEENAIRNYFGSKSIITIIPNFMELPVKEKRKNTNNYFLYVGRIDKIKALDKLIMALSLSSSFSESNYKLLLAGDNNGEYYEYLSKIISKDKTLREKIIFLGNVHGKWKNELYANAYFSLLVSHSENFGNVVIESLAQGTPVITSKGTPWQLLEREKSGFWIENDIQDIAKCIDEVIKMPQKKYKDMRLNAYKYSKSFDIYENIYKWINVINN